jgi:hypothetical protein
VDTPTTRPAGGSPNPYAVIFLVVAVLVGLGAATLYEQPAWVPTTANCLALADDNERLACYDTEFHRVAEQPAKGANVPLSSESH